MFFFNSVQPEEDISHSEHISKYIIRYEDMHSSRFEISELLNVLTSHFCWFDSCVVSLTPQLCKTKHWNAHVLPPVRQFLERSASGKQWPEASAQKAIYGLVHVSLFPSVVQAVQESRQSSHNLFHFHTFSRESVSESFSKFVLTVITLVVQGKLGLLGWCMFHVLAVKGRVWWWAWWWWCVLFSIPHTDSSNQCEGKVWGGGRHWLPRLKGDLLWFYTLSFSVLYVIVHKSLYQCNLLSPTESTDTEMPRQ